MVVREIGKITGEEKTVFADYMGSPDLPQERFEDKIIFLGANWYRHNNYYIQDSSKWFEVSITLNSDGYPLSKDGASSVKFEVLPDTAVPSESRTYYYCVVRRKLGNSDKSFGVQMRIDISKKGDCPLDITRKTNTKFTLELSETMEVDEYEIGAEGFWYDNVDLRSIGIPQINENIRIQFSNKEDVIRERNAIMWSHSIYYSSDIIDGAMVNSPYLEASVKENISHKSPDPLKYTVGSGFKEFARFRNADEALSYYEGPWDLTLYLRTKGKVVIKDYSIPTRPLSEAVISALQGNCPRLYESMMSYADSIEGSPLAEYKLKDLRLKHIKGVFYRGK